MIDTSKYEGHTPAPWLASKELPTLTMGWAVITGDDDWILRVDEDNQGELMSEADAQLIADAPKLLAEVKRLRKAIADIADEMEQVVCTEYEQEIIEDLRKVIE